MEQERKERLGFFRRMFLAVTDFRIYPFVQREKVSAATAYFTLLTVLITIFISISVGNKLLDGVSNLLYDYDENVPEFILKDGKLDVVERIYKTEGDNKFVVDTYMDNEEFANTQIGKEVLYSSSYLVINSDCFVYSTKDSTVIYFFKLIKSEITKNTLREYLVMIQEDGSVRGAIYALTWLGIFIAYYIAKIINILFLIIIAWILNRLFNMKLKFSNYYRIVAYALTLPMVIEMITILYLGSLPNFAVLVYQLLEYVYVFYALRALKLDVLIISSPGGDFKEKVENIIQKLEKDIEEKTKNEKDEEKRNDDKKDE